MKRDNKKESEGDREVISMMTSVGVLCTEIDSERDSTEKVT